MHRTPCLGLAAVLVMAAPALIAAPPTTYKIVVNSANPIQALRAEDVRRFFLKKRTTWPDGNQVLPVDLPDTASIRRDFSETLLDKKIRSVAAYWQHKIFTGRAIPPPERATDTDVLVYVQAHQHAIGYVSSATALADGVKVLTIEE